MLGYLSARSAQLFNLRLESDHELSTPEDEETLVRSPSLMANRLTDAGALGR
jgi:hypothetical protein